MTFIDFTNNVTNTEIVDSDAEGEQEAKDDPRVVLGSVQKRVHVVARFAGCGISPPTSAPRDINHQKVVQKFYGWLGVALGNFSQ